MTTDRNIFRQKNGYTFYVKTNLGISSRLKTFELEKTFFAPKKVLLEYSNIFGPNG